MAAAVYWKGYLKLSLVTCAVTLVPAATEGERLRLRTLNRRTGYPQLRQILVYPAAFMVDRVQNHGGVQQEQRQALLGESWTQGQVILSWNDTVQGAATANDGHNVVIHEFAHQLDQENGPANGAPPMAGGAARVRRWTEVFSLSLIPI